MDTESKIQIKINFSDLNTFATGSSQILKGQQVFDGGSLLEVGVRNINNLNGEITIEGHCIQSSHPKEFPHVITLVAMGSLENWICKCTCKAGLGGKCKHIFAVLLYIQQNQHIEVLTCTQTRQQWGRAAKSVANELYAMDEISKLNEFKNSNTESVLSQTEYDENLKTLLSDTSSTLFYTKAKKSSTPRIPLQNLNCNEINLNNNSNNNTSSSTVIQYDSKVDHEVFLKPIFDLNNYKYREAPTYINAPIKNFYKSSIKVENGDCLAINEATLSQDNFIWRNERGKRITASNCYELYTYLQNRHPDWNKKAATYFKPSPQLKVFEIGHINEPLAKIKYKNMTGNKILDMGLIIHPSCPWLGASPDGVCIRKRTLIEVKCVIHTKGRPLQNHLQDLSYLKKNVNTNGYSLKRKHKYYAQIQVGMFILNLKNCDFIIFSVEKNEIVIIKIKYNETFTNELIAKLYYIYFKYLLPYIFSKTTEADIENCR